MISYMTKKDIFRLIILAVILNSAFGCKNISKDYNHLIKGNWQGICSYNSKIDTYTLIGGDTIKTEADSLVTLQNISIDFSENISKITGVNDKIDKSFKYNWYNGYLNLREKETEIVDDTGTYSISVEEIFTGDIIKLDSDSLIMILNTYKYSENEKDYTFRLSKLKK